MTKNNQKHRGYFNKYHKAMPFSETILKDLSYFFISVRNYFSNNFNNQSILVFPHYPSRGSTIYKIGKILNYNITNKPNKNIRTAVYWEYLTFREEFRYLENKTSELKVINLQSRDISKQFIDQVHQDVFNYATIVNPTTYKGKIVKKNDINAAHDGQIIQGPITNIEKGYIYQILIDNSHSEKLVMDIRVPVVGKILDFAYIKLRDVSERFKNTTIDTTVKQIQDILSHSEIQLLNEYCKKLKLEYGELDVLRNKDDGKIYVVDVNNTPQGPPANTSKKDAHMALNQIAKAFRSYTSN